MWFFFSSSSHSKWRPKCKKVNNYAWPHEFQIQLGSCSRKNMYIVFFCDLFFFSTFPSVCLFHWWKWSKYQRRYSWLHRGNGTLGQSALARVTICICLLTTVLIHWKPSNSLKRIRACARRRGASCVMCAHKQNKNVIN